MCTNLHHFSAIVTYLDSCCGECNAVLQHFSLYSLSICENLDDDEEAPFGSSLEEGPSRINIDVVLRQGQRWVKVIARNPRALSQLSTGN